MMNPNDPLPCHSRAGGNPARKNISRSGQNPDVAALRGLFKRLDSRLRGNDAVLSIINHPE